jgi:hypothetical protein
LLHALAAGGEQPGDQPDELAAQCLGVVQPAAEDGVGDIASIAPRYARLPAALP